MKNAYEQNFFNLVEGFDKELYGKYLLSTHLIITDHYLVSSYSYKNGRRLYKQSVKSKLHFFNKTK